MDLTRRQFLITLIVCGLVLSGCTAQFWRINAKECKTIGVELGITLVHCYVDVGCDGERRIEVSSDVYDQLEIGMYCVFDRKVAGVYHRATCPTTQEEIEQCTEEEHHDVSGN